MKKTLLLIFIANIGLNAQKIKLENADLLANKLPSNFTNVLPNVQEWLGKNKLKVNDKILDLKTGKYLVEAAVKTNNNTRKELIVKNGDVYIISTKGEVQITKDADKIENNPTFSPDSSFIAYSKNNDLYSYNINSNKETRLTFDGTKTTLNGFATWIYYEEIYGRPTKYRAFWWSPDSKTIAYAHFDESKTMMFPIYSSEGQHGFIEETRYPKSGDANPTVKYGFVNANGGNTIWADINENDEKYLGWPKWMPDGSGLMVQYINRGNDDLKLYNVNPNNGSKKLIYEEQQKAWISIDEADERLTIFDDSKEMMIISDKSGWKQLYLYTIEGKLINAVTDGKFTVTNVLGIDQKNRIVYFHARGIENTARFDVYKVGFDGKNLKRLTFGDYNHKNINLSPDFNYFTTTYSNTKTPYQTAVLDNNGKIIMNLGSMKGENMDKYEMNLPELVRVKSDDGKYELPMTIIYPSNMESGKKYPVLISIYGGPDAGTVYDQWAWSARTQMLSQEGVIQVAMDHRASGHFGKEGVANMYRNLGNWELTDYKTMVKHLINKGIADPTKIAITGFSYGGFMTCLALTKGSDTFTHGMAGGSVTDWHLYDSAYTERFMDMPSENPEGYKNGSILTYATQLKGKLLLVHGTMDDNVHMQNSIQLIDKLEENNKDFEMLFYPGGRHGWKGPKWTHFDNEKLKFIYKYLIEKPLPSGVFN